MLVMFLILDLYELIYLTKLYLSIKILMMLLMNMFYKVFITTFSRECFNGSDKVKLN